MPSRSSIVFRESSAISLGSQQLGLVEQTARHMAKAQNHSREVIQMKLFRSLTVFAGIIAFATTAAAQTATQNVTVSTTAINQISVSGGAQTLIVSAAVAGSAPTSVSSSGLTWAITTNESTRKVTAGIDVAMAAGMTLTTNMTAPAGATSGGAKVLAVVAVDAVTGITKLEATGLSLVYTLSATSAAGVVAAATKVVTYTIVAGV